MFFCIVLGHVLDAAVNEFSRSCPVEERRISFCRFAHTPGLWLNHSITKRVTNYAVLQKIKPLPIPLPVIRTASIKEPVNKVEILIPGDMNILTIVHKVVAVNAAAHFLHLKGSHFRGGPGLVPLVIGFSVNEVFGFGLSFYAFWRPLVGNLWGPEVLVITSQAPAFNAI